MLKANGYEPKLRIPDNECSDDIKLFFKRHSIDFQGVPPHNHMRNAVEGAIHTWRKQFISGLYSTDPDFPISEWYHLLPQCDIPLNHLRSSRQQPKVSSHACLFGQFGFNRIPWPSQVPKLSFTRHQTNDPPFYLTKSMVSTSTPNQNTIGATNDIYHPLTLHATPSPSNGPPNVSL